MADACPTCGHRNEPGARFCSTCGGRLHAADETTGLMSMVTEWEAAEADLVAQIHAPVLFVRVGARAGSRFALDTELVRVGRHPGSDIFLDDITVSRRHADFHRVGNAFEVADAGSLNGTYVNRERVERIALHDRDEVQIGKFRLVYREPAAE